MIIQQLKPRQALNKAYLKVKPARSDMERFKAQLITLLDRTNDTESEEFHKNLVSDFLKKSFYDPTHFINTKGRNDLVIHTGHTASSPVGVLMEAKKPTNKAEMLSQDNLNTKAFHELVLYYLRERITHQNLEIKHLVATNIHEWFVFDAAVFDRIFAQNKAFVRQFSEFEGGRLADSRTDFFYKEIAEPFIRSLHDEIPFTWFDLRAYEKPLRNADKADDNTLITLFKILSPEHLLKLPFANDSNSLDKRFYSELLHIIGLTETKEGGKKLIGRNKPGERHSGTLLEEAIIQLDNLDKLSRLDKPSQFGANKEERLFNVALELSITWVNRILFLKLLEAQLISYHKGNTDYAFLHSRKIGSYDALNGLFFQVLAKRHEERNDDVRQAFRQVPYLNSSLFEPTEMEHNALFISNLRDDKSIPVFAQTVLKDEQGKRRSGSLNTLQYLFAFLDAYDFGAEGSEDIQEDNKTLINASVLGLIFEKINGYKDGSFFTPGFITMYMCRETIRRAVVEKFNEAALRKNTPPNPTLGQEHTLEPYLGQEHTPNPSQEGLTSTAGANLPGDATNHFPLLGGARGGFQSPGVQEHTPNPSQEGLTSTAGANLPGDATNHFPLLGGARGGFQAPGDATNPTRRNIIPNNPNLKELARDLRNNSTRSEIILWKELKGKFEGKYDFHRQKPLNNYIADFFCHELMLAIELDGESHDSPGVLHKDVEKERKFNSLGINVLRFRDADVFHHLDKVLETIRAYIQGYEKGDLAVFWTENTPLNPLSRGDFNSPGDATNHFPLLGGARGGFQSPGGQEHTPNPSQEGLTSTAWANLPGDATNHFPLLGGARGGFSHPGDARAARGGFQSPGGQEHTPNPSQEGLTSTAGANLPGDATNHFPLLGGARGGFSHPGDATAARGGFQAPGGQEHTPNSSQEGLTSTAGANLPGDATNHFPLLGGARGGFQSPAARGGFQAPAASGRFQSLDDLYDQIGPGGMFTRNEANAIINSLKICDPAVGSGHFLVSALNELIAVKQDLRILQDREGKRLKEYQIEVVNDELIITDEDGELFEYHPHSRESQRVQETLFHEKQTLIENCLFGVDINPNSVKICRLRLWIELLKNAYYKNPTELETLPNIDINIKCGNSLVSRFAIDADLKQALKKSKWNMDSYRLAVATYRNASTKEQKRDMERLITGIKSDFRSEIDKNDPKAARLRKLSGELFNLTNQGQLFAMEAKEKAGWQKKVEKLTDEIDRLEAEIEEIKANKIYENAFEWRFEFPEVLNDEGDFVGFDVVIGNPPYIRQEELKEFKAYFEAQFKLYTGTADIYIFFIEKGFTILKNKGIFTFILPNKFMQAGYGKPTRKFLLEQNLIEIIDFGDVQVFEEATTYPCILTASKENANEKFKTAKITSAEFSINFSSFVKQITNTIEHSSLNDETWVVSSSFDQKILQKSISKGKKLELYIEGMGKYGIKTGLTEAFVIDRAKAQYLTAQNPRNRDHIHPFLLGREVKPYAASSPAKYLIKFEKGFTKQNAQGDPVDWFRESFPEVLEHLRGFEEQAQKRADKGDFYWELRACDYYDHFEKPKIMYQVLQVKPCFIYDENGFYCNNSMWIIPSNDKVLLGILNSKMGWWLISKYCSAIQNGYQLIWKYFSQIPIATGNEPVRDQIADLVDKILHTKQQDPQSDTTSLEAEIDRLVYALYGLTEEEIAVVEGR